MTSPTASDIPRRFFTLARKLAMVEDQTAEALVAECQTRAVPAPQLAMQKGVLGNVQVEILQTLLHPEEAIPGYEIVDVIGHGGMGIVYRARQKNLRRMVALKTVLIHLLNQPTAAARFEQEARAVARLNHPNVITAFDFGRHEGRLFVALELVEGEDAGKIVSRHGKFTELEALWIARQTASGLSHAADAGVVHRDVKPSNLLLIKPLAGYPLPQGVRMVKIADFGLAFLAQDDEHSTRLTSTNTALGSPHYMAPEQLSGAPVDFRADIYGLGATLYHLLMGRPPFSGQTLTQIITSKLTKSPGEILTRADGISPRTTELLAAMMAREPSDRFCSYAELIQRIDDCLAGLPAGGTPSAELQTAPLVLPNIPRVESDHVQHVVCIRDGAVSPNVGNEGASFAQNPSSVVATGVGYVSGSLTTQPRFQSWIWAGMAMVLLAAPLSIGYLAWTGAFQRPPQRDLVPAGDVVWLFNGRHINFSNIVSGQWTVVDHELLGRVLSGSHGACRFRLVLAGQEDALPHYRFILFARLDKADYVDIRFGQRAADGSGGYAVRLNAAAAQLGSLSPTGDAFRATASLQREGTVEAIHAIIIERHSRDFFVKFDDKELGSVRADAGEAGEVLLFVKGGPAYFVDVQLQRMQRAAK